MKFEELYQELARGVEMIRALVGDDGRAGTFAAATKLHLQFKTLNPKRNLLK